MLSKKLRKIEASLERIASGDENYSRVRGEILAAFKKETDKTVEEMSEALHKNMRGEIEKFFNKVDRAYHMQGVLSREEYEDIKTVFFDKLEEQLSAEIARFRRFFR